LARRIWAPPMSSVATPTTRAVSSAQTRPLVLAYHAVSSSWRSSLAITEARLEEQLEYLKERGYVGFTMSEAERARSSGQLPLRSVVVTFDDGYASTMRAAPILEAVGFPGTVFVVTQFVSSGEFLAWEGITEWQQPKTIGELRPLSWDDTAELAARGWEIGSHTISHPLLTRVDDQRLRYELEASRNTIERQLGSCSSLAYPYGQADVRVADIARKAGYDVACMLTFAHVADDPLRRPRIGLDDRDHGMRLAAQLSGIGQAARRSAFARLARKLHVRRTWLPSGRD
jgi:peptidoglycan/xylan/chitin deacetylase (PgdA/CDA1 family)